MVVRIRTRDRAIQNALKRRDQLLQEMKKIDQFLEMYQTFAGDRDQPTPVLSEAVAAPSGERAGATGAPSVASGPSQDELIGIVIELMTEQGEPMTRGQILTALKRRGVTVGGTDERKNLGTKLWRAKDRIVNIEGHGYWPVGVPCPAVDYEPDNDDGNGGGGIKPETEFERPDVVSADELFR